jgi:hypothetical protein
MRRSTRYLASVLLLAALYVPVQATPRYEIHANDGPRVVGDAPRAPRPTPATATMQSPLELTHRSPYAHPATRRGSWTVKQTDLLTIRNDLVEVTLAPEIGAAILVYRLTATGDNYFTFVRENLNLRNTVWVDWGGFCDLGFRAFWGEPFYRSRYRCTIDGSSAEQGITGVVRCGDTELTRRCSIRQGSTALTIRTTQKNVGRYQAMLQVFNHPTLQLGKACNEGDLFFGRRRDGTLLRMPFVVGEEIWHEVSPAAGWAAATDPVERKAWVKLINPETTAAVGFWPSQNMAHWYMDQSYEHTELPLFHYYNGETLSHAITAQPGESLTFEETYFIVDGLPEVHCVAADVAGYLRAPDGPLGAGDTAMLTVGLGSASRKTAVIGELCVKDATGQRVRTLPVPFGDLQPGIAVNTTVPLPLAGFRDGDYTIELAVTIDGKTGSTTTPLHVDSALVAAVLTERAEVDTLLTAVLAAIAADKVRGADTLARESDGTLADYHLAQANRALAARQYLTARQALQQAQRRLARSRE